MSEPGVVVSLCVYRRDLDHLWMFMVSVFLVFYPFSPSSTAALSGGGGRDRVNSSERERGDREETERRRTDRNHDVTTAVVWRWAGSVQCKEVCVCVSNTYRGSAWAKLIVTSGHTEVFHLLDLYNDRCLAAKTTDSSLKAGSAPSFVCVCMCVCLYLQGPIRPWERGHYWKTRTFWPTLILGLFEGQDCRFYG